MGEDFNLEYVAVFIFATVPLFITATPLFIATAPLFIATAPFSVTVAPFPFSDNHGTKENGQQDYRSRFR